MQTLLQAYCEFGLGFFVLFGRGCMNYLFPASYAWGNFSILAVGIWAVVQRDSLDAIMMVSVRVFALTQLLRERVEGRNSSFESVMIFSCSQYSSQQVKLTFSPPREPGFYLSTINCGEKHSVSVILLLRGKEYLIFIFLPAVVTLLMPEEGSVFSTLELEGLYKSLL